MKKRSTRLNRLAWRHSMISRTVSWPRSHHSELEAPSHRRFVLVLAPCMPRNVQACTRNHLLCVDSAQVANRRRTHRPSVQSRSIRILDTFCMEPFCLERESSMWLNPTRSSRQCRLLGGHRQVAPRAPRQWGRVREGRVWVFAGQESSRCAVALANQCMSRQCF